MIRSLVPRAVLDAMVAVARACPPAHIAEVGVYQGGSAIELAAIAREWDMPLWLYDTFGGMPFAGPADKHKVGEFADTSIFQIRQLLPDAVICPGVFPQSLIHRPPMAFVHCDVDQYQSTRDVIDHLWPLLVPGGVMWFDDCELEPAMCAIEESPQLGTLHLAPRNRRFAVKPC